MRVGGWCLAAVMGLMLGSCTYRVLDNLPVPCDTTAAPTYAGVVKPILDRHCALSGCHDAATQSAGYDLSSYMGTKRCQRAGRLLGAIRHEPGYSPMPRGGNKLDSCDILAIERWIAHGMMP